MNIQKSFRHSIISYTSLVILMFVLIGCGGNGNSMGPNSSNGPSFDSGNLSPGETFSFTFEDQGTPYYCRNHQPDMTGKVIVSQDASISGQDTVEMKSISFDPSQITVKPGTKIVWINKESDSSIDPHNVTSGKPSNDGGGY